MTGLLSADLLILLSCLADTDTNLLTARWSSRYPVTVTVSDIQRTIPLSGTRNLLDQRLSLTERNHSWSIQPSAQFWDNSWTMGEIKVEKMNDPGAQYILLLLQTADRSKVAASQRSSLELFINDLIMSRDFNWSWNLYVKTNQSELDWLFQKYTCLSHWHNCLY